MRILDFKKDTRIVKKTLAPVWDEKFTFHGTLEQFQDESLELKLRDHDDGIADGDDDIGAIEVDRMLAVARTSPLTPHSEA